jgi:nucleoid-associated protein EbfC
MFNMKQMMQQAQQMQFKMQELQERLKEVDVEGASGSGAVRVVMSCAGVTRSVTIDPSLINPAGKEMLEDLIVAALNDANTVKDDTIRQATQQMMQQLGLPAGAKLPF